MVQENTSNCVAEKIINSNRRIIKTKLFQFDCKICLLDFIGANQYFISDFGLIWDRQNVFTNTFGILTRGSIPLVRKDPNLPYGWVSLKTAMPVEWFPVNQLLGWAFDPNPDLTKKYYITDHITYPFNTKDFKWVEHIDLPKDSLYREFINRVYGPL